ncbi:MAG: hypothetical protein KDB23_29905, partial [Planctomycetales bacterium]|nr:hypothetical protein [Planctomycetales bacterium]
NALIAAYTTALETGDMSGIATAMATIRYENLLADLNAAVAAEEGYGSLTAAETSELATALSDALAAGELETAQELVASLRSSLAKGHGHGGHGGHGHGHEMDDDDDDSTGDDASGDDTSGDDTSGDDATGDDTDDGDTTADAGADANGSEIAAAVRAAIQARQATRSRQHR